MLINDTHLLRLEPRIFTEASDGATLLRSGSDGAVASVAFSSASSDFAALDIGAGHVVVVNGEALEVDERVNGTTLNVSRPRVKDEDPIIAPSAGSSFAFSVPTFSRLIEQEEAWVLGALGIDPTHPATPLDDTAIVNIEVVERLIAHRVAARAYEIAAAGAPANATLAQRAAQHRALERSQRPRTAAFIDLDGDGVPESTRRIDVVEFVRG